MIIPWHRMNLPHALEFDRAFEHHALRELIGFFAENFLPGGLGLWHFVAA
jgi:hypothetical protein